MGGKLLSNIIAEEKNLYGEESDGGKKDCPSTKEMSRRKMELVEERTELVGWVP